MLTNITAREFLRLHCCDALTEGQAHARGTSSLPALGETQRYEIMARARQLRNAWFTSQLTGLAFVTSSLFNIDTLTQADSVTPRFSEPVILTDALSLFEFPLSKKNADFLNVFLLATIQQYGGQGNAYGLNYYSTTQPVFSWLTLKHERNRRQVVSGAGLIGDLLDKDLPFVPHLLRPFESLMIRFAFDVEMSAPFPHCGFRGVRVLPTDSPYATFSAIADRQIREYIRGASPELFLMEVKFPLADLGAIGSGTKEVYTPQQDRPLLILGAASNIAGAQARMADESAYYQFTYQDAPNASQFPTGTWYTDPPLHLIAPNTDFRNTSLFNMWPVPHALEPGSRLKLTLKNGTIPNLVGVPLAPASTRSNQDVRITFVCRTP